MEERILTCPTARLKQLGVYNRLYNNRENTILSLLEDWPNFPEGEPEASSDFALRLAALRQLPLPAPVMAPPRSPLPASAPVIPLVAPDDAWTDEWAFASPDSDENPEEQRFWSSFAEDFAFGGDLEGWDCGEVSSHSTLVNVGRKYVVRDAT
jgi:hypothetical protein